MKIYQHAKCKNYLVLPYYSLEGFVKFWILKEEFVKLLWILKEEFVKLFWILKEEFVKLFWIYKLHKG